MKMLTEHLKDFLKNMVWKIKTKRSSLNNIIQTEKETIMRFLEFQRILLWMRLRELTENSLFNIIPRTTQTMLKLVLNSTKLTRPTTLFQPKPKDTIMIFSPLDKLLQLEPITFLKISGETDSKSLKTMIISSDQLWETNGAEIWINGSDKETMKIGQM